MRPKLLAATLMVMATAAIAACSQAATGGSAAPTTARQTSTTTSPTLSAPATARTCPSRAPVDVPKHQRPGTENVLVPGQPLTLLACRYHGFNQPEPIGTFAGSARLSAPEIARGLDTTPRPRSNVVPNCPADFGEKYLLYFTYKSGPSIVVQLAHGGCSYVTNGDLSLPFAPVIITRRLEEVLGQDRR